MHPATCPVCFEKLICNFRSTDSHGALQEELECADRHYLYCLALDGIVTETIGPAGWSATVQYSSHDGDAHDPQWKEATIKKVRESEAEINAKYRDFWAQLVAPGGQLCLMQVKRELFDFSRVMNGAAHVFCHVTGNRVSKVLTDPTLVCQLADEQTQREVQDAIEDEQKYWTCTDCQKEGAKRE